MDCRGGAGGRGALLLEDAGLLRELVRAARGLLPEGPVTRLEFHQSTVELPATAVELGLEIPGLLERLRGGLLAPLQVVVVPRNPFDVHADLRLPLRDVLLLHLDAEHPVRPHLPLVRDLLLEPVLLLLQERLLRLQSGMPRTELVRLSRLLLAEARRLRL